MGFFSSKTKINVFSEAFPLGDEDANPVRDIIFAAVLTNNDITQGLIDNALYNPMLQVNPMINYARDYYTLGLAGAAEDTTAILDEDDVADAITLDLSLSYGALVDYNFVTNLTIDHTVLPFLTNHRGYDTALNTISIYPSGLDLDEYYEDDLEQPMTHKVTAESVILDDDLSTAHINYSIVSSYTTRSYNRFSQTYVYTLHTLDTYSFEEEYTINTGLRIGRQYCIAKYFELDSGFQPIQANNWWFYDISSGEHPTLDPDYTLESDNLFFPVVPIRYNNVDYTDVSKHETDLYKTSKILLKKGGLGIDELGSLINDNPDVGEIDHAYVLYGIDLQTTQNDSIYYLVEFFDYLHDSAIINQNDFINFTLNDEVIKQSTYSFNGVSLTAPSGTTTTTIYPDTDSNNIPYDVTTVNSTKAASLVEHGLDTAVTYSYITSHFVNGSIGVKGTATMDKVARTSNRRVDPLAGDIDDSKLVLRYQVSSNVYKEVIIVGLTHTNRIYGDFSVVTEIDDIINDTDNHNFLIPLHYGISKRLSLNTRSTVYTQAAHMVINGVVETTVRWYESGIFSALVTVVAIVIAVWTGQYQAIPWIVGSFMASTAINKISDPKLRVVLQIAVIVITAYNFNFGAISGKLSTAAIAIKNVSALVEVISTVSTSLKLTYIQGQVEDLAVEREAANKELEEINDLLDTSSFLDPLMLLDNVSLSLPRLESPDDFYSRTLDNNAGIITLDVIQNYHGALLTLPTADESIGFGIG